MSGPRLLSDDEDFPIKPWDIEAKIFMDGAFSDVNTCVSAGKLVCLARLKGGWVPLGLDEIQLFHELTIQPVVGRNGDWKKQWSFNQLLDEFQEDGQTKRLDVIVEGADGKYRFTDEFIYRCYHTKPLITTKREV